MKATSKLTLLIFLITVVLGLCAGTLLLILAHYRSASSEESTPELQKQLDSELQRERQAKKNWMQVVVALQDIPARSKVTREMVTLTPVPKELIVTGALTDLKQVDGRLTLTRIRKQDQIRASDLVGEGQGPSLAFEIPAGMRAIAIQAGEVLAVGTAVKPGDRVDILATYSDPVLRQQTTQMILQNVLVLAVNKGETDAQGKGGGTNSSMTLAVKPEEAELLTAADRAGALRVALRAPQN